VAPADLAPCTAAGWGAGGDAGFEVGNLKLARFLRTLSRLLTFIGCCCTMAATERRVDRFAPIRYDVIVAKSPIDPTGGNLRARRSDCRRYENVPIAWHPSPAPPAIDK